MRRLMGSRADMGSPEVVSFKSISDGRFVNAGIFCQLLAWDMRFAHGETSEVTWITGHPGLSSYRNCSEDGGMAGPRASEE
jgi:hypothetical protein